MIKQEDQTENVIVNRNEVGQIRNWLNVKARAYIIWWYSTKAPQMVSVQ